MFKISFPLSGIWDHSSVLWREKNSASENISRVYWIAGECLEIWIDKYFLKIIILYHNCWSLSVNNWSLIFDFRSMELAIFHFSYGTGEILANILNLFFLRLVLTLQLFTSNKSSVDNHGEQLSCMYLACKNTRNGSKACCLLIEHKNKRQSEARTAATVWNWSGMTMFPGVLQPLLDTNYKLLTLSTLWT